MLHNVNRVSFDDDLLILVDSNNKPLGTASKFDAHSGSGQLHRAFSAFVVDDQCRLLLQKRSAEKRLWPGFWANSCCSHPRVGEETIDAVSRRVEEELGASVSAPEYLFAFEYSAEFGQLGSEREFCLVYETKLETGSDVNPNATEVSDWGWYAATEIETWLENSPDDFTPWFKLEWPRVRQLSKWLCSR